MMVFYKIVLNKQHITAFFIVFLKLRTLFSINQLFEVFLSDLGLNLSYYWRENLKYPK